ncbi:hypothetical protein [Lutibacter sp.]|uniref:hypothetical protein n=1 Tax=Lutibacter sp. TaxID=1925666 RepID=UPI003569C9ED
MKTTSIQSYFYETESKMAKNLKMIVNVKGLVEKKYINTLTPKFSYKNHEGDVILAKMSLTL